MKIKQGRCKSSPAGEKKGQDKAGQDCDGPNYSPNGGGIWQMRPSMQSRPVAEVPDILRPHHPVVAGIPELIGLV